MVLTKKCHMLTISYSKDHLMVIIGKHSGQLTLESIRDGIATISKILVSKLSDLLVPKKVHAELVKLKSKVLK
jgi:hypothetical protein